MKIVCRIESIIVRKMLADKPILYLRLSVDFFVYKRFLSKFVTVDKSFVSNPSLIVKWPRLDLDLKKWDGWVCEETIKILLIYRLTFNHFVLCADRSCANCSIMTTGI